MNRDFGQTSRPIIVMADIVVIFLPLLQAVAPAIPAIVSRFVNP